jgi:hypothetical protein
MRNYKIEHKGFSSYKPSTRTVKSLTNLKNMQSKKGILRHHHLDKKITLSELRNWVDPISLETVSNISFNEQKYLIKIGPQIYDARQLFERMQYDFDNMEDSKVGVGFGISPTRVAYNSVQFQKVSCPNRHIKGMISQVNH